MERLGVLFTRPLLVDTAGARFTTIIRVGAAAIWRLPWLPGLPMDNRSRYGVAPKFNGFIRNTAGHNRVEVPVG